MFKLSPPDVAPSALSPEERRVALAIAEAILPGSPTIRPADERSLDLAERVIAHISPLALKAWIAGVSLLDRAAVLSTGKRFSSLDRLRQQELLEKWEKDPVLRVPLAVIAFSLKFTHFDTPEIYGALGGKLNVVTSLEQPRWLSQTSVAKELEDDEIECEVVVIGTGAGGAVVGKELADRGFAVVFVEEGQHHRRDAFTGSSVQAHFDFYRGAFAVGNNFFPIFMGRLVGGSTAINTGSCFRTPSWVLDRWCEELDTDALSPSNMEACFEKVERTLSVELADETAVGPIGGIMARGCDALGWSHKRMLRNAPGCRGEGFCDFGCRTDARKSTNLSYVPMALEKGAMLFTGLRATKIAIENGRATGIEGVDENGRTIRVRANAVVLSGGAVPTPALLLEQGIANSSGQVGRNVTLHPSTGFSALFDEKIEGHKYIPQGYFVDEFVREGILINAAQADMNYAPLLFPFTGDRLMNVMEEFDRIASWGLLIADATANGVVRMAPGGTPIVQYQMTKEDVARLHRAHVVTGEMCWAAGAKTLFPVNIPMPRIESHAEWKRFKALELGAGDLMLTSYHPLGSCRMGRDPKTSVVGIDHQSHDVERLFIVDASTVGGPLGVNPQITIMAMATRAAGCIAEAIA